MFKDRSLLARVRCELEESKFQGDVDIENLLSLPLLQSVYAETLRVRVEAVAILYSERDDIHINEWRIPRNNVLLLQTAPAHMDTDFWYTDEGRHPVDRFWADRFLEYPDKAHSGPTQKTSDESKVAPANNCGKPRFVGTGLANYFIPFGVGERLCPGRLFAKRLMIAFCAYVVQNFDVEILSDQAHFESNSVFFGIGTQRPKDKIPFRIRKRVRDQQGKVD